MGERNMVPLTLAIALAGSLAAGLGSYYTGQMAVERKIAQVREEYVKKEELAPPLGELKRTVEDLKKEQVIQGKEQAVQGQVLKDIKELLERDRARRP